MNRFRGVNFELLQDKLKVLPLGHLKQFHLCFSFFGLIREEAINQFAAQL
jgi:hypothetical protein